jgi:hypothetical protein
VPPDENTLGGRLLKYPQYIQWKNMEKKNKKKDVGQELASPEELIERWIYLIRGVKGMLGRDLAVCLSK